MIDAYHELWRAGRRAHWAIVFIALGVGIVSPGQTASMSLVPTPETNRSSVMKFANGPDGLVA